MDIVAYIDAVQKARPDIIIGPADIELGSDKVNPGLKRQDKMGERSLAWMRAMQLGLRDTNMTSLWAPILPIEPEVQRSYLEHLDESGASSFGGIVLYNISSIPTIPPSLERLPRLSLHEPPTPHKILYAISLGIDLFTIPFINNATDGGAALSFTFPAPPSASLYPESLLLDLWQPKHATALMPLVSACSCYTCETHSRAYINHLLCAKEMLAWVLLQVHNQHTISQFFINIRASIARGTFSFDSDAFMHAYDHEMPDKGGPGPRVRGYQSKDPGPGPQRANSKPYKRYPSRPPDVEKIREAREAKGMRPDLDLDLDLEDEGFMEMFEER